MALVRKKPRREDMMRVPELDPPPNFDARVRTPGEAFLNAHQNPTNQDFRTHTYWTRVHTEMYESYNGICSYSASWMPRAGDQAPTPHSTIDHFIPRVIEPRLAYEWQNFRIARRDMNENKGENMDIVDPFHIQNDWFELDFLTCRIKASSTAHSIVRPRIARTLQILRLNDYPIIDQRVGVIGDFVHGRVDSPTIERLFPFIAREITRQKIVQTLIPALRAVYP